MKTNIVKNYTYNKQHNIPTYDIYISKRVYDTIDAWCNKYFVGSKIQFLDCVEWLRYLISNLSDLSYGVPSNSSQIPNSHWYMLNMNHPTLLGQCIWKYVRKKNDTKMIVYIDSIDFIRYKSLK